MLVEYNFWKGESSIVFRKGVLFQYIVGENGVFCWAERDHLKALIPVCSSPAPIRGLARIFPILRIPARVPAFIMDFIVDACRERLDYELLFYLYYENDGWRVTMPRQVATGASVKPADAYDGEGAVIEIHSHNRMQAFFSPQDNQEETGFRIYAVIGDLDKAPALRARVSIYGHRALIDPALVFEPVEGVIYAR